MPNIIKETLDIACEDGIHLPLMPCLLDIHDQAGACIHNGGTLPPTKLIGGEETFGVGEVLEAFSHQLLE